MKFLFCWIPLLVITSLLFPFNALAQINELDSLEHLLTTNIPDSTKFDILYRLAADYNNKEVDKRINHIKQLIVLSKKNG